MRARRRAAADQILFIISIFFFISKTSARDVCFRGETRTCVRARRRRKRRKTRRAGSDKKPNKTFTRYARDIRDDDDNSRRWGDRYNYNIVSLSGNWVALHVRAFPTDRRPLYSVRTKRSARTSVDCSFWPVNEIVFFRSRCHWLTPTEGGVRMYDNRQQ